VLTVEFERLGLAPGARVLDVGCGGGRHLRETRRQPGLAAVGVDLGEKEVADTAKALREMDALAPELGGTVPAAGPWASIRASGYRLPFRTDAFDCVIVSEVLEHLERDEDALREVSRVLRPGGVLAVSVPREGPEAVCWTLSAQYPNSPGGHVRIYRGDKLARMLERGGYDIVGKHYAHALHSPYWWLKCLFGLDNERAWPVKLYHQFLVWDLMQRPRLTRALESVLNPLIGKSVVFYAIKGSA
jgi:SAM-dependent methyltransferase